MQSKAISAHRRLSFGNSPKVEEEKKDETADDVEMTDSNAKFSDDESEEPSSPSFAYEDPDFAYTDEGALFPRCEYYTRYQGTSYFQMDNPEFWGSYHRSEGTRFFKRERRGGARYQSDIHTPKEELKERQRSSYEAHVGSYHNPYSFKEYQTALSTQNIKSEQLPRILPTHFYNRLLSYKLRMCELVVKCFNEKHPYRACFTL
jgi:hypothetical protein